MRRVRAESDRDAVRAVRGLLEFDHYRQNPPTPLETARARMYQHRAHGLQFVPARNRTCGPDVRHAAFRCLSECASKTLRHDRKDSRGVHAVELLTSARRACCRDADESVRTRSRTHLTDDAPSTTTSGHVGGHCCRSESAASA